MVRRLNIYEKLTFSKENFYSQTKILPFNQLFGAYFIKYKSHKNVSSSGDLALVFYLVVTIF